MRSVNHVFRIFFPLQFECLRTKYFTRPCVRDESGENTRSPCTSQYTFKFARTFDTIRRIAHESHASIIERIPRKSTVQFCVRNTSNIFQNKSLSRVSFVNKFCNEM